MFTTEAKKLKAVIEAKDALIASMQTEIEFLRTLTASYVMPQPYSIKSESIGQEVNALLSGTGEQIDLNELTPEAEEIISERNRVLSGNY